jgi:hypothetical protein
MKTFVQYRRHLVEASRNDRTIDWAFAYSPLHLALGIYLTSHGISRILGRSASFANAPVPLFARTPLPPSSVYVDAIQLPFVETLIGIFESCHAIVFGMLLITLTHGSALLQHWQMLAPASATSIPSVVCSQ